ncbi:MAG: hypothetical protein Q9174_001072 [Haloplaca sp. 1 TL-2023]
MSAEQALPSPTARESGRVHTTPPQDASAAVVPSDTQPAKLLEGTPSQVTINVRDSTLGASTNAQKSPTAVQQDNDKDELASSSEPDTTQKQTPASPSLMSPPSSPSRSPEIEVAEIEDINQEPGHTRWRTLGSAPDPDQVREDIWDKFPYGGRTRPVRETSDEIARHLQHRKPEIIHSFSIANALTEAINDDVVFRKIADWVNFYLSATAPFPSLWLDMYLEEQQNWLHFLGVANALHVRW